MDTTTKNTIPVKEGMWATHDGQTHLLGSKCGNCGELFFPRKEVPLCANCQSQKLEEYEFSATGTVTVFTEVPMRPAGGFYKGPVPFTYAVVKLDDGLSVLGHIIGIEPEKLQLGTRVKTVEAVLWDNEEETVLAYKFMPVEAGGEAK